MSDFPKICVIGAGVSGICAGVQLKNEGLKDVTIFDENEEVGGTWFVNSYPGCACDIPTHLYSYSFQPNPNWTSLFSSQQEILTYLKNVAQSHNLYKNIKFQHQVKRLTWDENIEKWRVNVHDKSKNFTTELIFDIVISGIGGLRVPHIPKEFESFQGPLIHSARWDSSIDLENKNVGIVGSGASAIQIIPSIANSVKKLAVYQRHAPWVVPRMQFGYPNWMRWMFKNVPMAQYMYRSSIFWMYEISRPIYTTGSLANKLCGKLGMSYLSYQVGNDAELREKLTPNYAIGCKRVAPSDDYYSALQLPNVTVVTSPIEKVGDRCIRTKDGNEQNLDVLILATGFKVQEFFAPMEIFGKDGVNMMDLWKTEGPSAYLGITASVMPNMFFLIGPNASPGNNSAIFSVECQMNWTVRVILEMCRRKSKLVWVKESAEKEHMEQIFEGLKSTVWATSCGSWYTDHRGIVTVLNPSNAASYWNQTRRPDFTKLNFQ